MLTFGVSRRKCISTTLRVARSLCNDIGGSPLHAACWGGNLDIVKELLNHGADININDSKYGSALHPAVDNKYEQIVKKLLKNGCNTKVRAKLTYDNDIDLPDFTAVEMA